MGVDLLADMFTDHSPYHFGYNNPIAFADPSGLQPNPGIYQIDYDKLGNGSMLVTFTYFNGDDTKSIAYIASVVGGNEPVTMKGFAVGYEPGGRGSGGSRSGAGSGNSDPKGASNGVLEGVQTALDVAGLVSGFGKVAHGINAIIYLVNGDYVNASLSMAAMIPIGRQLATVGKLGMKAADATNVVHR